MFTKHTTIAIIAFFAAFPIGVSAYTIEQTGAEASGDFIIEPAKIEIVAEPGERVERVITVTNRAGAAREFTMSVEDTAGGDESTSVRLLGEADGPYPLKSFVTPEIGRFTLRHGERMRLPVSIAIPLDAEPGGRYGVVLFSGTEPGGERAREGMTTKLVSRLGALLFVRVAGDAREEGVLERFVKDDEGFEIVFRNSGNVHLNPTGTITIRTMFGATVEALEIEPYYSLPDSVRFRKVAWQREVPLGYYTATLSLNRGYDNLIDEARVTFFVVKGVSLVLTLLALLACALALWWVLKNVEIKRKY